MLASVVPTTGATGVVRDVKPVITLTVTNATASDGSNLVLTCASRAITFMAASALSADSKTMTVTLTPPTGAIVAGDTCTLVGDINTSGAGGTAKTPINVPFSIYATQVAKGLSLIVGTPDSPGSYDGALLDASFNAPRALSVGADGTVYVADGCSSTWGSHALYRKISAGGQVATIAGSSSYLNVGRTPANLGVSAGSDAVSSECPLGLTTLADGTVYSSGQSRLIEKISPQGQITTVAGAWGQQGAVDGIGSLARLSGGGITADSDGNLLVADGENHVIRKLDSSGKVTIYAGLMGVQGSADGALQTARFWYPTALKFDKATGKLIISDGNGIRSISNGVVSTLLTKGQVEQDFGVGILRADVPLAINGLDVAIDGRIAITYSNFRRALIYRNNVLDVRLGTGDTNDVDGPPSAAKFFFPSGVAFLSNGDLLISDIGNHNIKKYSATTNTVSLYAGRRNYFSPDDGVGSTAKINNPFCMVQAPSGSIWFSQDNAIVRKFDAAGVLSTVFSPTSTDPGGCVMKVNQDGSFVVAATFRKEIRLYDPQGKFQQVLATQIEFNFPLYSTVNAAGELFFSGPAGTIKKFANGNATTFATIDGGFVKGLAMTDTGNLIAASVAGIFQVTPAAVVTTIALPGPTGKYDDGFVGQVSLGGTIGVSTSPVVGRDGAIYIVSTTDSVIRKIYNGRVDKVVGKQWVNETKLGAGPGSIYDARALKYDATTNSLIIMTGNAILRAELP